jgi:hypothetical protein
MRCPAECIAQCTRMMSVMIRCQQHVQLSTHADMRGCTLNLSHIHTHTHTQAADVSLRQHLLSAPPPPAHGLGHSSALRTQMHHLNPRPKQGSCPNIPLLLPGSVSPSGARPASVSQLAAHLQIGHDEPEGSGASQAASCDAEACHRPKLTLLARWDHGRGMHAGCAEQMTL